MAVGLTATKTFSVEEIMRHVAKAIAAIGATAILPQSRYENMVLVLSHMRSASTALCNVICSHPQFSGYGETHVPYCDANAPGRVAVNLIRRRAFKSGSTLMLDKILHNHLDGFHSEYFAQARAIFLLREPKPAIASIARLSRETGMQGTDTPDGAAAYYLSRLERLQDLWGCFPRDRRIGLSTERLLARPDETINALGDWLTLSSPLENRYVPDPASSKAGAGDPTYSGQAYRIEARVTKAVSRTDAYVSRDRAAKCEAAHRNLLQLIEAG